MCKGGWDGANCANDFDDCAINSCMNGGTCTDALNYHDCQCPSGLSGQRCEIDVDECQSNPCKNDGVCVDKPGDYLCMCSTSWAGTECHQNKDDCVDKPCDTGQCVDKVCGYHCDCEPGFSGDACEVDVDECSSRPCLNDAACDAPVAKDAAIVLIRSKGLAAGLSATQLAEKKLSELATILRTAEVSSDLWDKINTYQCTCTDGYEGRRCQMDINECESVPCVHGLCMQNPVGQGDPYTLSGRGQGGHNTLRGRGKGNQTL